MAKRESPMAGDASRQLDFVAFLMGVDAKVLAELVAVVFHAKLDLFRVAGADAYATVIGFHAYVGAPSHSKGLGDLFRAHCDRGCGQQSCAGKSQPDSGRAV